LLEAEGKTIFSSIDSPSNPTHGDEGTIVGNWCSDVSGKTFAKWNFGKTWQNIEFKADGTGSTSIYYTYDDKAIGCEKFEDHQRDGCQVRHLEQEQGGICRKKSPTWD
jgi:hypothetical protein